MELIVISPSTNNPGEAATVTALFEAGLERFHLRKTTFSEEEMEKYVSQIPKEYWNRIVVRSAHHLREKYQLAGIHFTKKNIIPNEIKKTSRTYSVSCSAHTYKEAEEKTDGMDYMFLSPVFDSISKNGYLSGFDKFELKRFIRNYNQNSKNVKRAKIFALGGIDESNILAIKEMGFPGAAVLGGIWNRGGKESIIENFVRLKVKANP